MNELATLFFAMGGLAIMYIYLLITDQLPPPVDYEETDLNDHYKTDLNDRSYE